MRRRLSTLTSAPALSLLTCLLICLLTAAPLGAPTARADPAPLTERAFTVSGTPEPDGDPVSLDLTLVTADPGAARPAIVLAHGFGGSKADSLPIAETLARDGYAVIAYTARGFGDSGGLIHLDSPTYEGADARRIVDFAAGRPEIERTGDDPVIGFAGASYGGAVSLLAAALDPRVDAVVPSFTWNSLGQALFPQHALASGARDTAAGIIPTDRAGVFKQRWASLLFLSGLGAGRPGGTEVSPGSSTDSSASSCGRFSAELCADYQQAAASGRPSASLSALLKQSGPAGLLGRVRAPTLLIQGEDDTLFGLDQADANLRGLPSSTPKAMIWTTGGHDTGIDLDALLPDITSWFGRYLRPTTSSGSPDGNQDGNQDGSAPVPAFRYAVAQTSLVGRNNTGGRDPEQVSLSDYPGLGSGSGAGSSLQTVPIALTGSSQTILSPPGSSPAALTNLPGTGDALAAAASLGGYQLGVLTGQSATFTSAPLSTPLTLSGSGTVTIRLTSSASTATVFLSAWDLGPDRNGRPTTAALPALAVAPVRVAGLTPGEARDVTVALPSVVHRVPIGHRVQVVVASTDQAYAGPSDSAVYTVALPSQTITVPQLPGTTSSPGVSVSLPLVIVVSALVLAALIALIVLWARRRAVQPRADLAEVPLQVEGLVKSYGNGFKAVDGVSLRAEPGQVVGLLGPNGAGKTTTLRMLVGLIRPEAGSIWVNGQPVHAGADVLGSVGAFIEGPGFLPHLTGRQNLLGYWSATGRPIEDAHLDEALEIAGLGSALDRSVRGYSQGMRQRLGIAQAMLGLPSLLLLDEPTNGLDPPQIRAMRTVLTDYAATGRTVVVSSHLLAEVQQSCSHVVMMNHGSVVLTGSIAELTATDHVTLVGVAGADRDRAAEVLQGAGWQVEDAAEDEERTLRVSGDRPRAEVVTALVGAGIGLDYVDGRRQLEDVFMSLMAPGGEGEGGE